MASVRWGGLRAVPYDPNARDGDNDGVVQEGSLWERPAGSRFINLDGNDFRGGLDGSHLGQLEGLRLVDSQNKPIVYRQSWASENLTLAERFGTIGNSTGTVDKPPAVVPLSKIDSPDLQVSTSMLAELTQEYPDFFDSDNKLIKEVRYPFSADVFFAGSPLYADLSEIKSWREFRDYLKSKRIVAFDTETTGHMNENSGKDRIIQLGAVVYEDGQIVDRYNEYMSIPYDSLSDWAKTNLTDNNGNILSEEFLSEQMSSGSVLVDFYNMAYNTENRDNVIFLAHNAPFDMERMAMEFRRNNLHERLDSEFPMSVENTPYIDTMQLARAAKRFNVEDAPKYAALKKLQEYFDMEDFNWHSADADAEVAGNLIWKLIDFLESKDATLDILDTDKGAAFQRSEIDKFRKAVADYPDKVATLETLKSMLAGEKPTANASDIEVSKPDQAFSLISSKLDKDNIPLNISVPFNSEVVGKQPYELHSFGDQFKQRIRGIPISPDDPLIPDELFHASPAAAAILADGALRMAGEGGLGGDVKDRIVSLTINRQVAEQIADDMRLVVEISKAAKSDDTGAILAFFRKNSDELGVAISQRAYADLEMYVDRGDYTSAISHYLFARQSAGGPDNPLFVGLDLDKMAKYNSADIGVVTVKKQDLDTGAMLTNFDIGKGFLDELRVYGDVRVSGVSQPSKIDNTLSASQPDSTVKRFTGDLPNVGDGIDKDSIDAIHRDAMIERFKSLKLDPKELRSALEATLKEASPELVAKASEWYRHIRTKTFKMQNDLNEKYGSNVTFEEAAAVIAALSPAREFGKNVGDAKKLMVVFAADEEFKLSKDIEKHLKDRALESYLRFKERVQRSGGSIRPSDVRDDELPFLIAAHPVLSKLGNKTGLVNVVRAFDTLRTGDIDRTMSGPKMRSFYSNIVEPDGDRVTIDTWMFKAMIDPNLKLDFGGVPKTLIEALAAGKKVQDIFQGSPSISKSAVPANVGLYPEFADAVREVAARYGLSPAALQAIIWEVQRMRDGYAPTDWNRVNERFNID